LLSVHFSKQKISIHRFDVNTKETAVVTEISLSSVDDCYNLRLSKNPLMLTRRSSDNYFEIIWPERVKFKIHPRESFNCRENDKLYFSMWYEDPDYREEIIVRSMKSRDITEKYSGSII